MRFCELKAVGPLFVALTLVTANTQPRGISKRDVYANCDTGSLVGVIEGSWQAAIPVCAQYRAIVVTNTITSTTTSTEIRTRTRHIITTVDGKRKVKARDGEAEATSSPAPTPQLQGLGRRREGAAQAVAEQLEKCSGDAISVACNAANQQAVITTTTTVLKKTTVTSTTTSTIITTETAESSPRFYIYHEVVDRKKRRRSADTPPKRYYLVQSTESPPLVYMWESATPEGIEFRLSNELGLEGALEYESGLTNQPYTGTLYTIDMKVYNASTVFLPPAAAVGFGP